MPNNNVIIQSNNSGLKKVILALDKGEVVGVPTETVYGLAARSDDPKAIAKIFKIKNRPFFNPLIIHFKDIKSALQSIEHDNRAILLAERFWPGPLTIVGIRKEEDKICDLACAGLKTVAIRVPDNKNMSILLERLNFPLAAPSGNKYGKLSPTSANHIKEDLKNEINFILDGGKSSIGIESTIIDLSTSKNKLLRYGGIEVEDIKEVIGKVSLPSKNTGKILAPGMSASHYKPDTPMRINASYPNLNEAWLGFGEISLNVKCPSLTLSKTKNFSEAAANLYSMLRNLDNLKLSCIAVESIPKIGLGNALNDRLERAAS